MFEPIALDIPLKAVPWKAPTVTKNGTFKHKSVVKFQNDLCAMVGWKVKKGYFKGPVTLDLLVIFARGKGRKKEAIARGETYQYHDITPDRDNLLKAVQDALKPFWTDDAIVVDGNTTKLWGPTDRIILRIYPAPHIDDLVSWWGI